MEQPTALTLVAIDQVDTSGAVLAWLKLHASIVVGFAVISHVTSSAVAGVEPLHVNARRAILAMIEIAFVDVVLAPDALKAGPAFASEAAEAV